MAVDDDAGELVAVAVTRVEEEDFVRAFQEVPALRAERRRTLVVLVGMVVAVALLMVVSPGGPNPAFPLLALLVAVLAGWIWWRVSTLPRRAWRALAEWQRQARYEVRARRFRTRTEKDAYDVDYQEFFGWHESPHAFYLERAPSQFVVLPKRAFEADDAVEAARRLFAAKIVGRPKPAARAHGGRTLALWVLLVLAVVAIYQLVQS
ncbi:MAG TPA: YcxB family protein [Sandaracinaceae bacterium]